MEEQKVTLTEFKNALGEWVNRAAYGGTWVILTTRGRPKAALISMEDLEKLRRLQRPTPTSLADLDALRARIRARWQEQGIRPPDSARILRETREERPHAFSGLR